MGRAGGHRDPVGGGPRKGLRIPEVLLRDWVHYSGPIAGVEMAQDPSSFYRADNTEGQQKAPEILLSSEAWPRHPLPGHSLGQTRVFLSIQHTVSPGFFQKRPLGQHPFPRDPAKSR